MLFHLPVKVQLVYPQMDAKQAHQELQKRYDECRFRAPRILRTHGIPCVVWAEDALAYYGVPILSFELFVMVADVDAAAQCLKNAGYVREDPRDWEPLPELMEASSRLLQPPASGGGGGLDTAQRTIVVLLPAGRWKCILPSVPTSPETAVSDPFPFPALPALVDSIIDVWLDAPPSLFAGHINCHLAYVYDYIDQVRTPCFVEELQPAHRDFHLRYLAEPIRDSQRSEWKRRRDETSRYGGEIFAIAYARAAGLDKMSVMPVLVN